MAVRLIVTHDVFEDEGCALPLREAERCPRRAVGGRQWRLALQRQDAFRRAEQHPVFMALDGVLSASVIEARRAFQLEAHLSAHCDDPAYQSLAMLPTDRLPDRHEVFDLAHT